MAERIPRIAGEEVAAQPFGHRPGDGQQDQATIAPAQSRPALEPAERVTPAARPGKKPRSTARPATIGGPSSAKSAGGTKKASTIQ